MQRINAARDEMGARSNASDAASPTEKPVRPLSPTLRGTAVGGGGVVIWLKSKGGKAPFTFVIDVSAYQPPVVPLVPPELELVPAVAANAQLAVPALQVVLF